LPSGSGTGSFTTSVTGLTPGTTYYVKAYATNSVGTDYGVERSVTLPNNPPTVITTSPSSITHNSATSGGNVTSDGGSTVTTRGVCYSTSPNPTTANNPTPSGSGIGSFASSITGLSPSTTYYVIAYAINSAGTGYGTEGGYSFTTTPVPYPPSISTGSVSSITPVSANVSGTITDVGYPDITQHGHCWSTSSNPTTSNSKTSLGGRSTTGTYSSDLNGLVPNTTYYVRAYAENGVGGPVYGTQIIFSTPPPSCETGSLYDSRDGKTYSTVKIGAQWWMAENLNYYISGGSWYYNNSSSLGSTYGRLYNWTAANSACPSGWHLPDYYEWQDLISAIGGGSNGGDLKEAGTSHWNSPNTGATNLTCFTALPGGLYLNQTTFQWLGEDALFWSSSEFDNPDLIYVIYLYYDSSYIGGGDFMKSYAVFSVRCLKD